MSCPTFEEYQEAKKNVENSSHWIYLSKKKLMEYIDKLSSERKALKIYEECYEKNKEIVLKYEIYEQIKKEQPEKKEKRKREK